METFVNNLESAVILVFPDRRAKIALPRPRAPDMTEAFRDAVVTRRPPISQLDVILDQFETPKYGVRPDWVPAITLSVSYDRAASEDEIARLEKLNFRHHGITAVAMYADSDSHLPKHFHSSSYFSRVISIDEAAAILDETTNGVHPDMGAFSVGDGPDYNFVSQGGTWDIRNHPDHPNVDGKKFSIWAVTPRAALWIKSPADLDNYRRVLTYMHSILIAEEDIFTIARRPVFA